jgi:hypothetical protein
MSFDEILALIGLVFLYLSMPLLFIDAHKAIFITLFGASVFVGAVIISEMNK